MVLTPETKPNYGKLRKLSFQNRATWRYFAATIVPLPCPLSDFDLREVEKFVADQKRG
jgi:hypothetical protein